MKKKKVIIRIFCEECGILFINSGLNDEEFLEVFEEHCLINHVEEVEYVVERKERIVN